MAKEKEEKKPETTEPEKNGFVQIDPAVLQGILDNNKKLMERLAVVESESNMLKSIAGKAALKDFQDGARDFTIKRAHLKVIEGKVVVGWHKGVQDVFKNEAGHWVENCTIVVHFEDGEEATLRYIDFLHEQGMKHFAIRAKTEDAIDGTLYTLESDEGKTLVVKEAFLNP